MRLLKWDSLSGSLFIGLLFLLINITVSHDFYQMNSFKLVLLTSSLILLFSGHFASSSQIGPTHSPWKLWGVLLVPFLATFPGLLLHQGKFNYNLNYELVTGLSVILWSGYLYMSIRKESDISRFLLFMGASVLIASGAIFFQFSELLIKHQQLFSILGTGKRHHLTSTFGQPNYFAAFLAILLPLFFIFSLPDGNGKSELKKISKEKILSLMIFMVGIPAILITQARGAIFALFIAIVLAFFLHIFRFSSNKTKRRVFRGSLFLLTTSIIAILLMVYLEDKGDLKSRFLDLFTAKPYLLRLYFWRPIVEGLKVSPLFGFGLGSYYNLFFEFLPPESRILAGSKLRSANHAHSEVLEYLGEAGFMGLLFYLLFWGYLFWGLIKIIKSKENNPFIIKLAIAIFASFVAWHVHGLVSVAQRMVAVKLPLYSLIAILFALHHFTVAARKKREPFMRFKQRMAVNFVAGSLMVVVMILWYPWAGGQYEFSQILKKSQPTEQIEKLEKLVMKRADIYALDLLAHLQLRYQKYPELSETLRTIDQTFPNYRDSEIIKSLLAASQGDLSKAKTIALRYQQRDLYHLPLIHMLMQLAVETDDEELFFEQFKQFTVAMFHQYGVADWSTRLIVNIDAVKDSLLVEKKGTSTLIVRWNRTLVDDLFHVALKNWRQKHWIEEEKQRVVNLLGDLMESADCFDLEIKPGVKPSERLQVHKKLNRFYSLRKEKKSKIQALRKEREQQLKLATTKEQRKKIRRQIKTRIVETRKEYRKLLAEIKEYLYEKSDFKQFQKKEKLIYNASHQLANTLYMKGSLVQSYHEAVSVYRYR